MMVLADDTAAAAVAGAAGATAGSSRRRTRSTRGAYTQDAMDIEEDGRERKRVARR